jgi:hypothetical protein
MYPAFATWFLLLSFTTGNWPTCILTLLLLFLQQGSALCEIPAQLQALTALRLQFLLPLAGLILIVLAAGPSECVIEESML